MIRTVLLVSVSAAFVAGTASGDGLVAYGLIGELDRLAYDARSAAMGGAAIAVAGLAAAPAENPATLGVADDDELSVGYFGESPLGPLGTGEYFRGGTPDRIVFPQHFERIWRAASSVDGREGYGEVTVLGALRVGQVALFGTKGGIARPSMTAASLEGQDSVTVQGPGIEYEALGAACGFHLSGNAFAGLGLRQIRMYRAQIDYTATRNPSGGITVGPDQTIIEHGLEWAGEASIYLEGDGPWRCGMVVRHVTAPRFHSFDTPATWTIWPSVDVGMAWHPADSRHLLAADLRNVFGANGGQPILRIGWECQLGQQGRWQARAGLRDGRPTIGLGWRASGSAVDLSFGPSSSPRASFSATLCF